MLEEAQSRDVPLLDRVRFLAIVATHLDDFAMTRLPALRRNAARRMIVEAALDALAREMAICWRRRLLPLLRDAGIRIVDPRSLPASDRDGLARYVAREVAPRLVVEPWSGPAPADAPGLGLNFAVRAVNADGETETCTVRVPDGVPALVPVPAGDGPVSREASRPASCYVWLDRLVEEHLEMLLPDRRGIDAYRFRLLREMDVPPHRVAGTTPVERALDMLDQRDRNPVARLMVDRRMPGWLRERLAERLDVPAGAVRAAVALADYRRLWEVSRIDRSDLKAPLLPVRRPAALAGHATVLDAARDADLLFHHPYDSFQPLVEMIEQAARDPRVVSISMTLYRTDRESPVVGALIEAARSGRQVRVLVELHARLDERRNVGWSRALAEAGAAVFHAPAGLKVHAKLALIVRDEDGVRRRYAHLSSGNYNTFTAQAYTDVGLLTCDEDLAADVEALFASLCGLPGAGPVRTLAVAPIDMRRTLETLIAREIACQRRGEQGHIILKMNGLADREVIHQLYRASQEGVRLDLLVRGICCLRPGVPGLSDRIRVRSVVGRLLEHSRIWYFRNGGRDEVYIGSADLMTRNLDQRVEVMAPVKAPALRDRVRRLLAQYLADDVKAYDLRPDGSYVRRPDQAGPPEVDAQLALMHEPSAGRAGRADLTRCRGQSCASPCGAGPRGGVGCRRQAAAAE